MARHVHADVIHAWADGAEVQRFYVEDGRASWKDQFMPDFNPAHKYRIKPKVLRTKRYLYEIGCGFKAGIIHEGESSGCIMVPGSGFIKWLDEDWVEIEV